MSVQKPVNIEIMPALKSCEQGCPQCPLAKLVEHTSQQDSIDREVQKSFSIFERYLHSKKMTYDLHFAAQMDLFPKVKKPKLIRMARFESKKSISSDGSPVEYSDSIHRIITNYKIDPSEICFSFVPKSPVLTYDEIEVIKNVMKAIASWFLSGKKGKKLSCTIRSNFISAKKLERVKSDLNRKDRSNLNAITLNLFDKQRDTVGRYKSSFYTHIYGQVYFSVFRKKIFGNTIEISNRVISHTTQRERDNVVKSNPKKYKLGFEIHQAFYTSNPRLQSGVLFEPSGVMLNHSSLSINNPIMWLTHKDFRRILREHKDAKPFNKIIDDTVLQNVAMFDLIKEENSIEFLRKLDKSEFTGFFEKYRKKIFK